MQVDDKALAILDRKCLRLATLAAQGDYAAWLSELPPLLRWIISVPILNAYVKQIVQLHDRGEAEFARAFERSFERLVGLGEAFRANVRTASEADARWPGPQRWERFTDAVVSLRTALSGEDRRSYMKTVAEVLGAHVRQASMDAHEAVERSTTAARDARKSLEAALAANDAHALDSREDALRQVMDEAVQIRTDVSLHVDPVLAVTMPLLHDMEEWEQRVAMSPRTALVRIVDVCRAQHPPLDEPGHWTDFLPRDPWKALIESRELKENYARVFAQSRDDLARFVDELHVLGTSTLSHRVAVERFKERSTWYDKARLRDIAETGKGTREDRLTLELAKYLHDSGVFVLVRPRLSNLEPDVVGLNGLAVEAKAYIDAGSARSDIIHGYYQLHSYMTSLETEAIRVSEGFLVIFRVDGPIYETPPTIDTGRFLIHSMTIDLGIGATSGRKQPKTEEITETEIRPAFAQTTEAAAKQLARVRARWDRRGWWVLRRPPRVAPRWYKKYTFMK